MSTLNRCLGTCAAAQRPSVIICQKDFESTASPANLNDSPIIAMGSMPSPEKHMMQITKRNGISLVLEARAEMSSGIISMFLVAFRAVNSHLPSNPMAIGNNSIVQLPYVLRQFHDLNPISVGFRAPQILCVAVSDERANRPRVSRSAQYCSDLKGKFLRTPRCNHLRANQTRWVVAATPGPWSARKVLELRPTLFTLYCKVTKSDEFS